MNWLLLVSSCCLFIVAHAQDVLQWEKIIPSSNVTAPSGRRDSSIGYDAKRNRLVIFGGRSGPSQFADTWRFDLTNRTWSLVPPTTVGGNTVPEKRFTIVFGSWNDSFYISTGEGKSSSGVRQFYNDVYKFDYGTQRWQKLNPTTSNAPETRYGASGGVHPDGDGLFLSHGFSGTRYANTFKFEFKSNSWITLKDDVGKYNPNGPHQRCLQSGAMLSKTKMIMFGGCLSGGKTGGPCPAQDSWVFDAAKKEWKELMTCASPRIYSAMAMLPVGSGAYSVAVLYGGGETNNEVLQVTKAAEDEIMVYDPLSEMWERKRVKKDPVHGFPKLRLGHVMATTDNGIIMFGGSPFSDGGMSNELWLLKGTSVSAKNSPNPGKCNGSFFNLIGLHGIFMFLGWGLLLQLGAFIARYLRHKDPLWFLLHRALQATGLLFAIGGFVCGILSVRFDHMTFAHAILGLIIMIVGLLQPVNAFFRPHKPSDGEKASTKRTVWEWLHKLSGRLALILAFINISLGLFLGLASRVVWGIWFGYMSLFVVAYVLSEVILRIKQNNRTSSHEMSNLKS